MSRSTSPLPNLAARTARDLRRMQHFLLDVQAEADMRSGAGVAAEKDGLLIVLEANLADLRGEPDLEAHDDEAFAGGLLDRLAGFEETGQDFFEGLSDSPWEFSLQVVTMLNRIATLYSILHASGLGSGDTALAGMAWNHMKRIHRHLAAEQEVLVRQVTHATGRPSEANDWRADQALKEWRRSWNLALFHPPAS